MTFTNVLIAINVIAYIWLISTGGLTSTQTLEAHGALLGVDVLRYGEWWRIVTGAFLHGSILHIAFNMIALYQLGTAVELFFGKLRFSLLYWISLIGSGLAVVYVVPNDVTVGASGAIFGLFGALIAMGVRLGKRGRGLIAQVLPIIVINLIITFTVPNISAAGHIGGLVTGFLVGLVLFMLPSREQQSAYAFAGAPDEAVAAETIEQPPHAGPHEEEGDPAVRDPRE